MSAELQEFRQLEPKLALAKKLKVWVWVLSVVVIGLVVVMGRVTIPLPEGVSLSFLPMVNAIFNTGAAIALVSALVAIKGGRVQWHRRFIVAAFVLSGLFLLSYVSYHFTTGETKFGDVNGDGALSDEEKLGVGKLRFVYYLVLASHIILAAFSLPFILMTLVYAVTNQFAKHRKIARWIFPIWLYVAVTGPVCYLFLKPYY